MFRSHLNKFADLSMLHMRMHCSIVPCRHLQLSAVSMAAIYIILMVKLKNVRKFINVVIRRGLSKDPSFCIKMAQIRSSMNL
jgi:hypothetical protein